MNGNGGGWAWGSSLFLFASFMALILIVPDIYLEQDTANWIIWASGGAILGHFSFILWIEGHATIG
jgi:hypothetical protein